MVIRAERYCMVVEGRGEKKRDNFHWNFVLLQAVDLPWFSRGRIGRSAYDLYMLHHRSRLAALIYTSQ